MSAWESHIKRECIASCFYCKKYGARKPELPKGDGTNCGKWPSVKLSPLVLAGIMAALGVPVMKKQKEPSA